MPSTSPAGRGTRPTPPHLAPLLEQLKSPDATARAAAEAAVCTMFEPLAKSLAHKYSKALSAVEFDDLQQVARLGLVDACRTFDEHRGAFTAHAQWAVRKAFSAYVAGPENPMSVPQVAVRRISKLRKVTERLGRELQRKATMEELSTAMGTPVETILAMLAHSEGHASLDAPRGTATTESTTYAEPWVESCPSLTLTPEEALIAAEDVEALRSMVPQRELAKAG